MKTQSNESYARQRCKNCGKLIAEGPEKCQVCPVCGYQGLESVGEWTGRGSGECGVRRVVECPICGGKNDSARTFRCPECGRGGLCLDHRKAQTGLCEECETNRRRLEPPEAEREKREGEVPKEFDKFFSGLFWANRPECRNFANQFDSSIIKMAELRRLAREGRIPKAKADEECRAMMEKIQELYRACGNPPWDERGRYRQ